MRLGRAFIILVCTGLSGPVFAGDGEGRYAVEGPGRLSCADLTALPPDDPVRRDLAVWLSGYMTAHHRLLPETFDLTPWQTPNTLMAMVAQYCQANPSQITERAAQELVSFLAPHRVQTETPALVQRSGDQVTVLYQEVLDRAVAALAGAGFPVAAGADGLTQAVGQFQNREALPVTGALDQATLAILLK